MYKRQCTQASLQRYFDRISQPLIDRMDLCVEAPMVTDVYKRQEERFPKKIRAGKSGKQKVRFQYFEDCYKENAFLAEDIRQTVQNGVPLSEIAVLFRTNMQPRALMEYMVSANLAFQTKDRIPDIYEHWIARDFFTYIRIAQGLSLIHISFEGYAYEAADDHNSRNRGTGTGRGER